MPAGSKTLRITYVGFKTLELPIKENMKILLQPDEQTLNQVVVTGITKIDRRLFTGHLLRFQQKQLN